MLKNNFAAISSFYIPYWQLSIFFSEHLKQLYIHWFLFFRALNSIDMVLKKLAHHLEAFLQNIIQTVVGMATLCSVLLSNRDRLVPHVLSPLKSIRQNTVYRLIQVKQFVVHCEYYSDSKLPRTIKQNTKLFWMIKNS